MLTFLTIVLYSSIGLTVGFMALIYWSLFFDEFILPKKYKLYLKENPIDYETFRNLRMKQLKLDPSNQLTEKFLEIECRAYRMDLYREYKEKNRSWFTRYIMDNI